MKDIHLMFNELTERYRNYHEIVASFVRINTTNISEIQEIYQKFKSISSEINVFPSGLIPCIFNAYKYNNRYLKSYYLIFKMFYDEFQIKFDSPEHQALSYFLNKEYGFPIGYRDQKLFGNYSLDLHEKNTIYRSIMDDDKDSFIVFIESESFDKEQKLKHHFYPESSEGYSFLELCCYHGAVDCFKLLRTKFKSEITPQCLQFSFLSGKPEILNECLKFQKPDQECMKYAIISFNIDFITFLNREHGLDIDLETCRLWMNFQAFFVHLDISKDIDNCFVYCANFGPSVLEYFISNGCNINAKENKFKRTALHIAVTTGNKELIELLLYKGANVHSKDSYGEKSLSYAVGLHYNKIVETLIKFGADYTSKDIIGAALFAAARSNNYDVAEFLILNGANVNIGCPKVRLAQRSI
ncbi:hypothetical protein TVAG_482310 [Trichomonas vaginalis G3]|uniref:DUF3447 domain-containing protein n=1 Tax=Trichomonas vaginalis (strain ATCC PRA-98 / G3) TaxID=412133 RepID=A2EBP0_TRIV3|nr:hypothetical protein TVAG_482310 [Trichomonas vaginalis G3]|eukprot:XP_001322180.1 hypothetical protein [Trichomonas vaginalis G3]